MINKHVHDRIEAHAETAFTLVTWSRRKLSSIVSWLTQRLLDRIVVHAECLSYWLRGLTYSTLDRYAVSPVALLIATWSHL